MKLLNLLMCLCVFSGCGNSKPEDGAKPAAALPATAKTLPGELKSAVLSFQSAEGIHVMDLTSGKTRLVAAGGRWPRWSPDGTFIAFVREDAVCRVHVADGREEKLAAVGDPRAVAVSPEGREIWFTDGEDLKAARLADGTVRTVWSGTRIYELDIGPGGNRIVGTVKDFGYKVKVLNVETGTSERLGKGCSASFSPDGKVVTNNVDGHVNLALLDASTGREIRRLPAPEGTKTDNQFWSNHPDWIVSMEEDSGAIFAHRVSDGKVWTLTERGGYDRPDLFVPKE